MKTISATELRTHCARVLDEVERTREPVVVTKRGKPVARIVAAPAKRRSFYGVAKGEIDDIGEDLFSTGAVWEADSL
jgi:prevent-host-death family protein